MDAVLSVVMLTALALVVGAIALWRRGGSRKQVLLMIVLALVALVNVAIWTLPDASGDAPLARISD